MANNSSNFEPISLLATITYPTLATAKTLTNGGVLVILLTDRDLRRDMFSAVLLSLSLCDMFVGLSLLFCSLALQVDMLRNLISCVSSVYVLSSTICLSNVQILYICIVRVVAVTHPHTFRALFSMKRHYIYTSVISLTIFIIFGIPTALWIGNPDELEMTCTAHTTFGVADSIKLLVAIALLSIYIATLLCYLQLIRTLRRRIAYTVSSPDRARKAVRQTETSTANPSSVQCDSANQARTGSRQVGDTAKTLGVIIGLMGLLVVPSTLFFFIRVVVSPVPLSHSVHALAVIPCINSFLNPFVYAGTMKTFQAAIRRRLKFGTAH